MARGKRKAKKMTIEELQDFLKKETVKASDYTYDEIKEIEDYCLANIVGKGGKLAKDLEKIEFDFENCYLDEEMDGFASVGDFTYFGMTAGGDWEEPIFLIFYVDPSNKLRGYIPSEGNFYNKDTKEAFGNDEEADEEYVEKMGYETINDYCDDFKFDRNVLEADILNRIEVN